MPTMRTVQANVVKPVIANEAFPRDAVGERPVAIPAVFVGRRLRNQRWVGRSAIDTPHSERLCLVRAAWRLRLAPSHFLNLLQSESALVCLRWS